MGKVAYITREITGSMKYGNFPGEIPARIDASQAKDISLNLSPADVESYSRQGSDLHITLANGQELVLENYYSFGATGVKSLFLSTKEGEFIEVVLEGKCSGMLYATYEPHDLSGKWSAYDEMVFLGGDRIEPVVAPLAAPLFGGLGAVGMATGVVGAAVIASDDGGGGRSNNGITFVSIDSGQADGDDTINNAEAAAGLILTGTGEAGATVSVTVEGVTRTATVGSDGNWAAEFEAGSLPTGEYDSTISVTSTDEAGNTATATADLHVDTLVDPLTVEAPSVEGDGIVNASERSDGVTLTGTVEPGSTVVVQLGSATETASVDSSGNWTVDFAASDIPEGSYEADVTVTATDAVGNTAEIADTLTIDTDVMSFGAGSVTNDNMINIAERDAGVTLTGTVEPGSFVEVIMEGVTRTATVDSSGYWSATFGAETLPDGTYIVEAEINASDLAGNTRTQTQEFKVDTDYDSPNIRTIVTGSGITGFFSDDYEAGDTTHELTSGGSVEDVTGTSTNLGGGSTLFSFDETVPDGSNLVVNRVDDAGNSSGTMVVFEDGADATVLDHAGLSQFNIDELNLVHADNVDLTLSEADINALSGNSDTLTVHGGSDDTLTISGATANGSQTIDGETYDVYTLGADGTTILVDEDVNTVI